MILGGKQIPGEQLAAWEQWRSKNCERCGSWVGCRLFEENWKEFKKEKNWIGRKPCPAKKPLPGPFPKSEGD